MFNWPVSWDLVGKSFMKEIIIETVANGFIARINSYYRSSDKQPLNEIYVFSTTAQLTAWIEKWSVERKKEMPREGRAW